MRHIKTIQYLQYTEAPKYPYPGGFSLAHTLRGARLRSPLQSKGMKAGKGSVQWLAHPPTHSKQGKQKDCPASTVPTARPDGDVTPACIIAFSLCCIPSLQGSRCWRPALLAGQKPASVGLNQFQLAWQDRSVLVLPFPPRRAAAIILR